MANKIEPNGNPGGAWFNTEDDVIRPGEVITSNGIRYEFGNVRHGFDNDGDYVPDFNAWAQPIGDPSYDPSCFRLIHTSGVLTVTRSAGQPDMIVPFQDQLYFMNLPPDNTGVTGNVFYTFLALDGPCQTSLSPYQEVASGFDNEKFNGDFGAGIPPVGSLEPEVTLDKSGNLTVDPGERITYTLEYSNTGDSEAGLPLYSTPLVLSDPIPDNTSFSGYLEAQGFTVLYSADGGETYTTTQPSPASLVTNVQLWMTDTLAAHSGGVVTFSVEVAASPPVTPVIENCADARFDSGSPFAEDCTTTLITGDNAIGDWVWEDGDSDGLQDDGPTGIDDVTLTLYWDADGDGELDDGDPILMTSTTAISGTASGYYLFEKLPDGDYLVAVESDDPYIPFGYNFTTPEVQAVDLDSAHASSTGVTYRDADFGFGPVLRVDKASLADGVVYEGETVTYTISLVNTRPGNGTDSAGYCQYTIWSDALSADGNPPSPETGNQIWQDNEEALGAPNSVYAVADLENNTQQLGLSDFNIGPQAGNILTVEYRLYFKEVAELQANDNIEVSLWLTDTKHSTLVFEYAGADFPGSAGDTYVFTEVLTRAWAWSDFTLNRTELGLVADKGNTAPYGDIGLDAAALIITTDQQNCGGPNDTISVLPMTDTYDASKLRFVSADPPATATGTAGEPYAATGVISWTNLGPLYAGQVKQVTVFFEALEPANGISTTITNTVTVTHALYANGRPVHEASDWVTDTVQGTGSIGDVVWNDITQDGVQDSGEPGIPFVVVELWQDDGDGSFEPSGANSDDFVLTTTTTITGFYLFDGLPDGDYFVRVDATTLPTGFTQTGDPDGTLDHVGGTTTPITINNSDASSTNDDDLDQDFGYSGNTIIDGTIWHDRNQSATSTPDDGEEWLTSVTITLTNSSGAVVATTTSDQNGYFRFVGAYNGTYTVTVGTGTGDMATGTWTQSYDTDGLDTGDAASVTVSTGGYAHVDYSYYQTGATAVGDTLYYDWDGDATQDDNEEGVPNVTVSLYEDHDGDGFVDPGIDALIATTVTADGAGLYPSGYYTFTNLPADDYVVVVDQADPDFPTTFAQTQDPDEDGAACVTCDSRGSAHTTTGSVSDIDFGYQPAGPGVIGDTVWRDMDGDGAQSGVLETGITDSTVWLYVDLDEDGTYTRVMTTTTDFDGQYLFQNLADADYRVGVDPNDPDLPVGSLGYTYVPSTPTSDDTPFTGGSTTYLDADFGFMPLGAIGDTIYWDTNRDGEQDWDEVGIPGIVITLTNTSVVTLADGSVIPVGSYVLTQTTNASGEYLFSGLPAGTFDVTVGSISGDPALTGDPDTNGIPCHELDPGDYLYPFCDGHTAVDVSPGTIFLGADFGYQPVGVIGDFVWHDLDRDGVQDAGEPGIAGVVVTVTNGSTYTTVTDIDGYYFFQSLSDGTYTVSFEPQTDLAPTVISADAITNGVGSVGLSTSVEISGGVVTSVTGETCADCSLHIDSGFVLDGGGEFGGHVFFDAGGTSDGTSDAYADGGDTGYAGVTVYLRDDQGRLVGTTVADASGVYTFTNLPATGVYTVAVNLAAPRLSGMDLTASNHNPGYTFATVTLGQYDHDFGFNAEVDYGDLPDSYSTSVASAGPGHVTGALYLGASVDTEGDGRPDASAQGDDMVGDDEDGIERNPTQIWYGGATVNLTATVSGDNGYLVAYFDWNGDGDVFDAGERVVFGDVVSGTNLLTLSIPSTANPGTTLFSRFRLYDRAEFNLVGPTGMATNGEVEDYQWSFTPTAVDLVSFTATPVDETILLQWQTSAELDSLGFNLYRADSLGDPRIQLNQGLIPSQMPGSSMGASYRFIDDVVEMGVVYTYWLEEVDIYGRTTRYGPVTASLMRSIFLPLVIR
ncbi:MAG: SdrD B-like domain-containing protein [Anaerolineae bacterium]